MCLALSALLSPPQWLPTNSTWISSGGHHGERALWFAEASKSRPEKRNRKPVVLILCKLASNLANQRELVVHKLFSARKSHLAWQCQWQLHVLIRHVLDSYNKTVLLSQGLRFTFLRLLPPSDRENYFLSCRCRGAPCWPSAVVYVTRFSKRHEGMQSVLGICLSQCMFSEVSLVLGIRCCDGFTLEGKVKMRQTIIQTAWKRKATIKKQLTSESRLTGTPHPATHTETVNRLWMRGVKERMSSSWLE